MTTQLTQKLQAGQDLDKDDMALLNSLVQMQEAPTPEPDDKVVRRGNDTEGAMVRTKTTSAGYVWLRRASDGKLKEINRNQLAERLKQKLDDGSPAWMPPNAPWKGRVRVPDTLCLLSRDHPDRPHMDKLNLEVCAKRGKLLGVSGMRRHMMKKHKDAWAALQLDTEKQERDAREAREVKRDEALLALLGAKAAPVVVAPAGEVSVQCETCGEVFEATAMVGARAKLRAHVKKAHGG